MRTHKFFRRELISILFISIMSRYSKKVRDKKIHLFLNKQVVDVKWNKWKCKKSRESWMRVSVSVRKIFDCQTQLRIVFFIRDAYLLKVTFTIYLFIIRNIIWAHWGRDTSDILFLCCFNISLNDVKYLTLLWWLIILLWNKKKKCK